MFFNSPMASWLFQASDGWAPHRQGALLGLSQLCWYALRSGELGRMAKAIIQEQRSLTVVAGTQADVAWGI